MASLLDTITFSRFLCSFLGSSFSCSPVPQVAVRSLKNVRGGVQSDQSEPDGAAEPSDGEGHRVVPQTLGKVVSACG